MRPPKLKNLTADELVDLFAQHALGQDDALLEDDIPLVNKLYGKLEDVEGELKSRDGDQRTCLLRLYSHPNAQVRLKAVKATLAVAPALARKELEKIAASREFPQAGEAGMSISNLDRGIFKPT